MADLLTEQLREIAAAMGNDAPEAPLELPSTPLGSTASTPQVSVALGVRVAIGAALAVLLVVGGIQLIRPQASSVVAPPATSVPPLSAGQGPWIQLDSPPQTSFSVAANRAGWCFSVSLALSETVACTEPGMWKLPGLLDWQAGWGSEPPGEVFGLASPEVASVLFEFADGTTASVDTFGSDAQLGVAAYLYQYDTTERGLVALTSAIAANGQMLGTYDQRTDLCSTEFEQPTGQLVDKLCTSQDPEIDTSPAFPDPPVEVLVHDGMTIPSFVENLVLDLGTDTKVVSYVSNASVEWNSATAQIASGDFVTISVQALSSVSSPGSHIGADWLLRSVDGFEGAIEQRDASNTYEAVWILSERYQVSVSLSAGPGERLAMSADESIEFLEETASSLGKRLDGLAAP